MDSILPPITSQTSATADRVTAGGRRAQVIELSVFLLLIVPGMALSFVPGAEEYLPFQLLAIATIVRDVALVALVLFFLWRAGETPSALGWSARHLVREVAVGALLFVPLFLGGRWLEGLLLALGLSGSPPATPNLVPPRDPADVLLAVAMVAIVAMSEETIFRGYLLHRLRAVVGSTAVALVAASAIFAVGHGYEGTAGAVTVGVMGAAFGAVYLWRRSLVAAITMHFLLDLVAIVLLPLMS